MIGWLSGTVRHAQNDLLILDANGVGYEVLVPASTILTPIEMGKRFDLFIHTHVREDDISLYGFASFEDRELFRILMTVSGIGAKTALHAISSLPRNLLVEAIRTGNLETLRRIPGIGKKTAERMVVELRDRIAKLKGSDFSASPPQKPEAEDLISALVNLGYRRPDVEAAVSRLDLPPTVPFDRLLRESLRLLSR